MPIIPCPNVISGCDCIENSPFRNISAEAPDLPVFLGVAFDSEIPPLGTIWDARGCMGTCESTVSQEAANLCAQEQAFECGIGSWRHQLPNVCQIEPALCVPGAANVQPPQVGIGYSPFVNAAQTGQALCPDGLPFFFTVPAGVFAAVSQAAADSFALSYANRQAQLRMVCLSIDNTGPVCPGTPFTATITATGKNLALPGSGQTNNWVLEAGVLPPGLTFNGGNLASTSATITGKPTQAGSYLFFVGVTDPQGDFMSKAFTITIAGITNTPPAGTGGNPYNFQFQSVGFTNPLYSLAGGVLPAGLTLFSSGLVTGTPTGGGVSVAVIQVSGVGIVCQQAVTFVMQAGGLDFNNLAWVLPNGYTLSNTGSSGGNANSYQGAQATVDAIVPSGVNDGWGNQALMTYTGPQTPCQVKITLGSFTGGNASAQAQVSVYQDGTQLVSQAVQVFPTTINFTVQAGNASQIQIGIEPPGGPVGVAVICDIIDFPGPDFEGIVNFEFLPHS